MRRTAFVSLFCVLELGCAGPDAEGTATQGGTEAQTDGADASGDDSTTAEDPGDFGPEQSFEMRLSDDVPPPLVLEMNREEVAELFGDRADEVLLLELDSTVLLTETLEQIKNACGQFWREDDADPDHDCSLTPLGQTFMGPDGTWQTSAEYSLVRILTMTPANVVVDGTSSDGLQGIADALGIGGGYGQILSDALGIARTDSVVSTDGLVVAFRENFVGTHPNIGNDAALTITLADALSDLATLADRYGPVGDHPGIIDPSFIPHGEVLAPEFQMRAVADSNLRTCDGVDADQGKGYISVVADVTGPDFEDELEFHFDDPERFSLTGLVANPTVDLRFAGNEHPVFVPSCLGDPPCQDNEPGNPQGNLSVWGLDPWKLEYTVAAGARNDYLDRSFYGSYALGTTKVLIGQDGNPPGWVAYDVPFDVGNPPEPQYVWETILEVAQVALHATPYGNILEGDGNFAFTLFDVPVGITGAEAAEAVRPYLQEQSSLLSDFLLGDYKKNNDRVDFYWRRGDDGEPYLFFTSASDLVEGEPYAYASPGFFRQSDLTADHRVSSTEIPGLRDTEHEKLAVPEGETVVYFADDGGLVYRARIVRDAGSDELEIHIA
ncbi:MAG: hypothetical protein IAG13_28070, partial [Deltaproteobacteria bacterium]|nr:hypothetical protein [Nannocystaceae bacterium]